MKFALIVLTLFFSLSVQAQWLDGDREQSSATASNGFLYVHDGAMYFFNAEKYMTKSTNNGTSWVDLADNGLGEKGLGLSRNVTKMEYANGRLYIALNYGNSGAPYYSVDGGDTWLPDTLGAPAGPSNTDPHPVISDMEVWGRWLYVHWVGNALYTIRGADGVHVLNAYMVQGAQNPRAVVSHGDTLFVLSGAGVYYTVDGGANFTTPSNLGFTGNLAQQLIMDGSRLYATTHLTTGPKVYTLLYSDDAGNHWTQIDISGATAQKQLNGSGVSPIATFIKGQRIEMSFQPVAFNAAPNVWKSNDLGKTWTADTVGLPNEYAETVTGFAYTTDGDLWAVRAHENIYKQKIDEGISQPPSRVAGNELDLISMFPNPARSELTLASTAHGSYAICDALGHAIMHGQVMSESEIIALASLHRGTYWLLFRDEHGHSSMHTISLE